MTVANSTPNASEAAIGTKNAACMLRSASIGIRPANVVNDVRTMGRNRCPPAWRMASSRLAAAGRPAAGGDPAGPPAPSGTLRARLMKSTMIRLSLTTMPVRATKPSSDRNVTSSPITTWPHSAPTRPNGMAPMMMIGCAYDRRGIASRPKIMISASSSPARRSPTASSCASWVPLNT